MLFSSLLPLLSEKDSRESSEGGLDPLGFAAIADALAVQLAPGVRERQRHPRFLTAIAASLAVCEGLEDEAPAPGAAEPWLAFEWHVVEGLVRTADSREDTSGLPGSLKARQAIAEKVPLGVRRYLKTPSVAGFHGVYRLLARTLGIERGGCLAEVGYDLLQVWEREQGLDGFTENRSGSPGGNLRRAWRAAVRAGMLRGSTVAGTERMRFREHLDFKSVASREAAFLARRLQEDDTGYRGEVLRFLVSRTGRKALSSPDDGAFCAALLASSPSPGLSALLRGIAAYEAFARLVTDAFEAVLDELAKRNTKIDPTSLARLPDVAKAGREASRRHQAASEALEPLGLLPRFQENFAALAEPGAAADWLERLVEHHRRTQRQKSPVRKAPWFDRFDDGDLMILYRRDSKDRPPGDYVHRYRVGPLDSFARDLGLF